MKHTLAIIHTTPITIDVLKELAKKHLPDTRIINLLDDSILPELAENGGDISTVEKRLLQYAGIAVNIGASILLSACSSVGDVAEKMGEVLTIPVVRIDEAMAEFAISQGKRIGVIATVATTLNPTVRLLKKKAEQTGCEYQFNTVLADDAYKMLISGKPEAHDQILVNELKGLGERSDLVVLAQASMARAVKALPEQDQSKFITSPELGMIKVKSILKGMN